MALIPPLFVYFRELYICFTIFFSVATLTLRLALSPSAVEKNKSPNKIDKNCDLEFCVL